MFAMMDGLVMPAMSAFSAQIDAVDMESAPLPKLRRQESGAITVQMKRVELIQAMLRHSHLLLCLIWRSAGAM